jgi:hypothetical protein
MKNALTGIRCGISINWNIVHFSLLTNLLLNPILDFLRRNLWQKARQTVKNSLVRNPDVVLREEDPDGALLFNPDTNQIRVINTTGLFIWKPCRTRPLGMGKSMLSSFSQK